MNWTSYMTLEAADHAINTKLHEREQHCEQARREQMCGTVIATVVLAKPKEQHLETS